MLPNCTLIVFHNSFEPKSTELRYFVILSWLISPDNKSDKPVDSVVTRKNMYYNNVYCNV